MSSITLFVTQECNMQCPYCYGDAGRYGTGGVMSEETACRSVDWLMGQTADGQEINISFFGGEPLLNLALLEKVVVYAREKAGASRKLTFSMSSNLSLLDEHILGFVTANRIQVLASIDGPRHIQNRNRPLRNGHDSYDTVVSGARMLLSAFPGSTARSTLVAGDDPSEVMREVLALGFRHIQIEAASGCLITGSASTTSAAQERGPHRALATFYHQVATRFRQAVAMRDADEVRALAGLTNLGIYIRMFVRSNDLRSSLTNRRSYYYCGQARIMAAVAANGDIYPCHRFVGAREFCIGNVCTGKCDRDECLRSPVIENPECASCWARYICGGDCRHNNAPATGDPMRPDPCSCADKRSRIEYAIHASDCLRGEDLRWVVDSGIIEGLGCRIDL